MLKQLYLVGGTKFFQMSSGIKSLYEWGRKHLFIAREDIIWNRGGNFSKFIDWGRHWGTSHRGTWTVCEKI